MVCTYSFTGADGQALKLVGKPALKAYLAMPGGMAHLLPARATAMGIALASRAANPDIRYSVDESQSGADTSLYGPATQRHRDIVSKLQQSVSAKNKGAGRIGMWNAVVPASGPDGATARSVAAIADRIFGREVVYIDFNGEPLFNGAVSKTAPGVIFLNSKAKKPLMAVMGHELLHEMAKAAPGVYAKLSQRLDGLIARESAYTERERAKYRKLGLDPTSTDFREELEADIVGDNFMDPAFWREIAQDQPGLFQKIADHIVKWLDAVARKFTKYRPFGTDQFLADVARARAAVAEAVREFSGTQVGVVADGADAMSAASTDQTSTPAFKKWFGNSGVVNPDGSPRVVYHGTRADFGVFRTDQRSIWGEGAFFTTDRETAEIYAQTTPGTGTPRVVEAYLKIESPEDGTSEDRGAMGMTYLVKKPENIKSATENNGDFDAENPDIRFSRAAADTGLTPPEQGLLRRVQASIQDNMNRVRQVQDRIVEMTGKPIPQVSDYYGAETNRPGRVAARLEDAKNTLTKPLMEGLAKSGRTPAQLEELLHAMHAQERNERVAEINQDMPDGGSGMLTADANAILAKYAGDKALHKLADQARGIAKATLELKLAYGLIDIDTFTALASAYDNYVPLKGDGEYGPKIKRAMGHEEREEQILENIARDYDQAVVTGERNQARQALLAMVLQNPDPALWSVGVPPRGRFVAGKVYSVNRNGKTEATFTSESQVSAFLEGKGPQAVNYEVVDDGGERVQAFVKPLQDHEVMVYLDGKPVRIQITGDEALARQLRPLDQAKMHVILEWMRSINRYLSKIYTGMNPAFILRNATRDAITGTINIMGTDGAVTAAAAWSRYPAAVAAMGQWAATGSTSDSKTGKYLEEYRANGGKTGASWMADLEAQGKSLKTMYDDAYGATGYLADGKPGKAAWIAGRKIVGGMAHVVEIANQATENGLRLALYMTLRDQGRSAGEAAQAAKRVTVDFDRKGSMTGALGAIFLFFNPAVQGTANALKTLTKGDHKAQAWTALGMLGLLGMYAASQGMDDDKDRWLGENWDTRTKNLILKIGDQRIRVPMSQEFAPFFAFGVAMAEASRGESKMATAARMISSFIDAYFPLQGAYSPESDNHQADAMGAAIPTVLKPFYQAATNRNSFGSKIVPESDFTKDRPDNLKMNRSTKNTPFDAAAQGIAKAGEAAGYGRYENDISKISPETLKHYWRTYTGGLGTFIADSIGVATMTAADPAQVEKSDVPIVKDFFKTDDVKPIRGRFYNLADGVRAAASEFGQAKKAGDGEAMDQILAAPGKAELISLDRLVRHTAAAAAKVRDQEVDINADKSLTPAQKRAALKDLEKQEEAIYRAAIDAFK